MVRLFQLSIARRIELECRYDGPIPAEMIEQAWAQDQADRQSLTPPPASAQRSPLPARVA